MPQSSLCPCPHPSSEPHTPLAQLSVLPTPALAAGWLQGLALNSPLEAALSTCSLPFPGCGGRIWLQVPVGFPASEQESDALTEKRNPGSVCPGAALPALGPRHRHGFEPPTKRSGLTEPQAVPAASGARGPPAQGFSVPGGARLAGRAQPVPGRRCLEEQGAESLPSGLPSRLM